MGALFKHLKIYIFYFNSWWYVLSWFVASSRLNGYFFRCESCLEEFFAEGEWIYIFEPGHNIKIVE